jgi:hypothetical protein
MTSIDPYWGIISAAALSNLVRMEPTTRSQMSELIAADVNRHTPRYPLPQSAEASLHNLRQEGIIRLGQVFSKEVCAGIVEAARQLPCYAGHVPAQSDGIGRPVAEVKKISPYGSYKISDTIKILEFLKLGSVDKG